MNTMVKVLVVNILNNENNTILFLAINNTILLAKLLVTLPSVSSPILSSTIGGICSNVCTYLVWRCSLVVSGVNNCSYLIRVLRSISTYFSKKFVGKITQIIFAQVHAR